MNMNMKMKINLPDFTINPVKIINLELILCKIKINFKKNFIISISFYKCVILMLKFFLKQFMFLILFNSSIFNVFIYL